MTEYIVSNIISTPLKTPQRIINQVYDKSESIIYVEKSFVFITKQKINILYVLSDAKVSPG